MNIANLVIRNAASRPDHPAIIEGDRALSFGELAALVNKSASHLRNLSIKAGDRVGVCLKDNTDHVVMLLAVARAGAAIVPIDWRACAAEKQRLVETLELAVVLTEAGARGLDGVACVPLDESWRGSVSSISPFQGFSDDGALTFILNLSSGTSGEPRGAVVTHDDYRQRLARYATAYGVESNHRYLSVLPLCFSAGRNKLLYNLVCGGTAILYPTLFGPEEFVDVATRYDVTAAYLVPTAIRGLLRLPEQPELLLPNLKILATGSSFIFPEEMGEAARRISPNLVAGYSTSGTGPISVLLPEDLADHAETVGMPNRMVKVEIVDDDDQPLPTGETGRLRCKGPGVSRSYYGGAVGASDEGIKGDWFYTGELGALDDGGYLRLNGRSSSLIVRGGANVYPEEVERVMLSHDGVAEAAVIGRSSRDLGEEVVAAIIPKGPVGQGELLALCRKELSAYKVPVEIRVVRELPKTTSGKVKRGEVLACFNEV